MDRGACGQTSQDGHSRRGAVHSQVECQGKESKVVHEESGEHSKLIKSVLIMSGSTFLKYLQTLMIKAMNQD